MVIQNSSLLCAPKILIAVIYMINKFYNDELSYLIKL